MKIRYLPEALAEYQATAAWYEEQSPGSGDDFVAAIERAETARRPVGPSSGGPVVRWALDPVGPRSGWLPSIRLAAPGRGAHPSIRLASIRLAATMRVTNDHAPG